MDYFNKLVGGKPAQAPIVDDAFADYAAPAAATPILRPDSPADLSAAQPTGHSVVGSGGRPVVYTKWYRVWERTQLSDFYLELGAIPLILLALTIHYFGTKRNRRTARKFMAAAGPVLDHEFAIVGYGRQPKDVPYSETQGDSLINAAAKLTGDNLHKDTMKEKSAFEFESYATGRQNIAFMDIKIFLWKWYNPLLILAESIASLFFDSLKQRPERVEIVSYSFDGREKDFVAPPIPGSEEISKPKLAGNSTYDQFIFAVVNKQSMRRLRDERYDLSLTFTKEHPKLPVWASVMSESAEVTDTLLNADLIKAIEGAGDNFDYLIISDQPVDKPSTIDEAKPRKRLQLSFSIPAEKDYANTLKLLQTFIRTSDYLASSAHFRPEVNRKIKQVREEQTNQLRKVADKEAEEERIKQTEKLKKEERERKMKGMTAEEQRKFLEKEADKQRRKQTKKMTTKG